MTYNTVTLPNGLRIIHRPDASRVLYCGYQIAAGTRNELPGEEGLAHFCEHMTFKGTSHRSAMQIINHLERVGGDLNAFTTKEATTYYAAILNEHVGRAVDLLTDIVFSSEYPETELEREKTVVCEEIESYNDTPSELIFDEFENMLFQGHPLGHNILGTEERVRSFTQADLQRFARRWYRPDNAIFFAYGDISFPRLVKLLEKATDSVSYSANIQEGQKHETSADNTLCTSTFLPSGENRSGITTLHMDTHQAHVMTGCRAYPIDDPRRMALYIMNNILGGPGMNARLNIALRERHGLVYTVESTLVNYGDTGTWGIYFGCDHADVRRCLRLVRRELDRLMRAPLTTLQLNAAKRQLKGQIGVATDNREQFALDFGKSFLHYGREKDIERLFQQIDTVTPEQIHAVANDLFAADHLSTIVIE